MARESEGSPTDEEPAEEYVEEVESVSWTGRGRIPPNVYRSKGKEKVVIPEGVLALRQYSNSDSFYVTLTQVEKLNAIGLERGDWVGATPEKLGERDVLYFEAEEVEDEVAAKKDRGLRKIIDNNGSVRLTPPRLLLENNIGLDLENYEADNPPVFEMIYFDTEGYPHFDPSIAGDDLAEGRFALGYLGAAEDVFRPMAGLESPIPDETVLAIANQTGVNMEDLTDGLSLLAKTIGGRTFETLGIDLLDDPVVIEHDGWRSAVYYISLSDLYQLSVRLFEMSDAVAEACFRAHYELAHSLISDLHDGLNPEHPLNSRDGGAIVVPLDQPGEGEVETTESEPESEPEPETGEKPTEQVELTDVETVHEDTEAMETSSTSQVREVTIPPTSDDVLHDVAYTMAVDEDELEDLLERLAERLDADAIHEAELATSEEYEPVTLPFDVEITEPYNYDSVTIHFVRPHALETLAESIDDVEPFLASAAREAHNRQAEQLISGSDLPAKYHTFSRDADAIIVPETGDEDTDTEAGRESTEA